jgi:hypothetical protein
MLKARVRGLARALPVLLSIFLLASLSTMAPNSPAGAAEQGSSEQRASDALEDVRDDPLALYALLKRMPKGADLHSHVTGATYAESHIRAAIEDKLCVDTIAMAFAKSQPVMAGAEPEPVCEQSAVPASQLLKNPRLYSNLVDSFSMRGFVPSEGETGNDHFFRCLSQVWRHRSAPSRRVCRRGREPSGPSERAVSGVDGGAHLASPQHNHRGFGLDRGSEGAAHGAAGQGTG